MNDSFGVIEKTKGNSLVLHATMLVISTENIGQIQIKNK